MSHLHLVMWSLFIVHRPFGHFVICSFGHWSLVIGHWSLVIWSLVIGYLVICHLVIWSFRPSFGDNRGKILGDNRGKIFGDIKGTFFFAPEGQRDFLLRPGFRGHRATGFSSSAQRGKGIFFFAPEGQRDFLLRPGFRGNGVPRQKLPNRSALPKSRVRTPSGDPVGHPFGE